jgi:hypothetical protein
MTTTSTNFKNNEVLVLLGAGASVDAGIPHSAQIVQNIEGLIAKEWSEYGPLYNYLRSAIFYAEGIRGKYDRDVNYNIENLVVALDELARREEHPLYPFIGAWNPRLTQVAGNDFVLALKLKTEILKRMRHHWIEIPNYESADYFKGLVRFQKELQFPLHVFTLNYDLCVEKAYHAEYGEYPERGFLKAERRWSPGAFEGGAPENSPMYLYKLHGSIDWVRDANQNLTYHDGTSTIDVNDGQLIFGTTYKLQYVDPFLFLVYQLRRLSLEARLIITIGYGFGDEHINGILKQALQGASDKRLVAVTYFEPGLSEENLARAKERFMKYKIGQLGLGETVKDKVELIVASAKDFLTSQLTLREMSKYFPQEESFFANEVAVANEDAVETETGATNAEAEAAQSNDEGNEQ